MTTPRDDIAGLSERLRERTRRLDSTPSGMLNFMEGIAPLIEGAATQLDSLLKEREVLEARVKDCEEVLADKRRLAREIDIALHGDEGAAKQASLCDLVEPAKRLRARVKELEGSFTAATKAYDRAVGSRLDWRRQAEQAESRALRAEQERDEAYERAVTAERARCADFAYEKHDWPPRWIASSLRGENDGYSEFIARRLASGPEKEKKE